MLPTSLILETLIFSKYKSMQATHPSIASLVLKLLNLTAGFFYSKGVVGNQ
jgi:hypothetical protein